jgi:SPP1 family predicted phage head-tail adaptor
MRSGLLRSKVTIQNKTESRAADGQVLYDWTTYATAWASISTLSGSELLRAQQIQAKSSHLISCRYLAGVTAQMRVVYGTEKYNIVAVNNVEHRNVELRLTCEKVE